MSYFIPVRHLRPVPKILGRTPDVCLSEIWSKMKHTSGPESTQWIYLHDCVSRGTISPMEAYQCLDAGYVLEGFKSRDGAYEEMI